MKMVLTFLLTRGSDRGSGAALPVAAFLAHTGHSKRFHKATSMTCFSMFCIFCQSVVTTAAVIWAAVVIDSQPMR